MVLALQTISSEEVQIPISKLDRTPFILQKRQLQNMYTVNGEIPTIYVEIDIFLLYKFTSLCNAYLTCPEIVNFSTYSQCRKDDEDH